MQKSRNNLKIAKKKFWCVVATFGEILAPIYLIFSFLYLVLFYLLIHTLKHVTGIHELFHSHLTGPLKQCFAQLCLMCAVCDHTWIWLTAVNVDLTGAQTGARVTKVTWAVKSLIDINVTGWRKVFLPDIALLMSMDIQKKLKHMKSFSSWNDGLIDCHSLQAIRCKWALYFTWV